VDPSVGRALPAPGSRTRLVAIDVDGTLLTSRHDVTPATVDAVGAAKERGAAVVLTTSRPPGAVWPILARLGLVDGDVFIGCQGAIVGSFAADGRLTIIAQQPMPLDDARTAVDAALLAGLAVNWYTGEDWLVSHVDDQVRREAEIVGMTPTVADLAAQPIGPDKMLVIAPDGAPAALVPVAVALPGGLHGQTSKPTYLEVTRADVDKTSALRVLCASRGISPAEVVAIGDGMNDLGMLAFAGTAIAPANAHPDVLAAAHVVTPSNDEDGVAVALRALLPGIVGP
jgi:Cof subfamily protein (haloacid dehalogenase superfamily)